MSELIALNLRASSAGSGRRTNSRPTRIWSSASRTRRCQHRCRNLASSPDGDFDSNGAYDASTPKRTSLISAPTRRPPHPAVVADQQRERGHVSPIHLHYGCSSTVLNKTEPDPGGQACRAGVRPKLARWLWCSATAATPAIVQAREARPARSRGKNSDSARAAR